MRKYFSILCLGMLVMHACGDSSETPISGGEGKTVEVKDGRQLFTANCAVCHAVKMDKMGPALAGSLARWNNDTARLITFIQNSPAFIATGDPYAVALHEKWNKATMTPFPNLTEEEILKIIDFFEGGTN